MPAWIGAGFGGGLVLVLTTFPALVALGAVLSRGKNAAFFAMFLDVGRVDAVARWAAKNSTKIWRVAIDVFAHETTAVAVVAGIEVVAAGADMRVLGVGNGGEFLVADMVALDPLIGALVVEGVRLRDVLVDRDLEEMPAGEVERGLRLVSWQSRRRRSVSRARAQNRRPGD